MNDSSYLSQPALPAEGTRPAKQARSLLTRNRIVAAAQKLIGNGNFEDLTVSEIAREAKCSVGAFYQRFEDKEALFRTLVADMVAEVRAGLIEIYRRYDGDPLVDHIIAAAVRNFRNRQGLMRATVRKGMADSRIWDPIREHGHFAAGLFAERLGQRNKRRLTAAQTDKIGFAFQVLHGTLINTLIHDPGPLTINDPRFEKELNRVFRAIIG
ncbi:MAG TPA: TetR/AcrR family transcriptional regulator [Xanthobacteraceae bacterium]|nr:TetR/AcrR family transcriptional regulator [Xanthobacteraceae bacterium]